MTPNAAQTLRLYGLAVSDERIPGRPYSHEVKALGYHWTAGKPTSARPAPSLGIVKHGRPKVPGPLYGWLLGADLVWRWITDGYANHFGSGNADALRAAWAGNAPTTMARERGLADTTRSERVSGNGTTLGVSVDWHPDLGEFGGPLREAFVRGIAALLIHHKLTPGHAIGHSAYTARKWDWPSRELRAFADEIQEAYDEMTEPLGPEGETLPEYGGGWMMNGRCVSGTRSEHGAWQLFDDGGVATIGDSPYLGGLNNHPDRVIGDPARIIAVDDGYDLITTKGHRYPKRPQ